jgi:GNAT superfamily N-acetyltransferase
MWWRTTRAQFARNGNKGNRQAFKALVEAGEVPGILAYAGGLPIGWCSIAPREQYGALERSPVLRRVDEQPVWSIVCFVVHRDWQRQGVATKLIQAAVAYARSQGARLVEAYPRQPAEEHLSPGSIFMGLPGMFASVGFVTLKEPAEGRYIMRIDTAAL